MSSKGEERVTIFPFLLVRQTDKARLIEYCGLRYWIPKSITDVESENEYGIPTRITIPEWFANKEDILV